ncbi:hypothetical protein ACH492_22350 [Streptomyces sp. NPDC019443]|uniref:hypothetical protein n=1 Tax=Streptomyces sp. NPDC019443 TaxID=3365061 RepID=UPI00378A5AF2
MSPAVETAAWVAGIWLAIAVTAAIVWARYRRQPPLPQRTPADVYRDAADCRARREAEQVADDLDNCQAIWPDPPSWRTAEAQHRHDTAKQQREEG